MAPGNEITTSFKKVMAGDYGARFYNVDLHFHTPASEDARGKNRYNFNPYEEGYPAEEGNFQEYYEKVKEKQEELLDRCRKLARQIVKGFLAKGISLVAVTDHNGLGTIWNDPETSKKIMDLAAPTWYELIDDEAQEENKKQGKTVLTILPGVEISTTGIHILAIFPPQTPRREIHFIICDLLNDVGFEVEEWGKNPKVGKASIYNTIELITAKKGLPIIAHADGSDQAILKLYKINSGAMKNVLTNRNLNGIEIVDPRNFKKRDKKLNKPLSVWMKELREKNELTSLAFFQGSDAHQLKDIARRFTKVKMTEPSFSGLKIALHIPASRVRLCEDVQKLREQEKNSRLYIYGIEVDHPYFGKEYVRFNPHLNCVVGKLEVGKSTLFKVMQSRIKLFMERKTGESQSEYYAICIDSKSQSLYSIKQEVDVVNAEKLAWEQLKELAITPHFYKPEEVNKWIASEETFNQFLEKRFGAPDAESIKKFNETFAIPIFLEEKKEQLLYAKIQGNLYKIYLNTRWNRGKERLVEFSKLDNSLRQVVLTCIMIISGTAGPLIIDAPEEYFNNEDIVNYLVPIITKYKDIRQFILFTNHPLLAINTDPENYILLERKGKKTKIRKGFSIDKEDQRERLIGLIEGDLGAFHKRRIRYDLI